jgi:hypothetical protein
MDEAVFTEKNLRLKILSFIYPICENCDTKKTQNGNKYCWWCGFQILRADSTNIKIKTK